MKKIIKSTIKIEKPKDEILDEIINRGVENIYPSKEFFKESLVSGKKLKIYLGIDPTGPTLHLGHAIILRKLGEFQKLGHKVILLIGDFTAMIGDPTGKSDARNKLTHSEVMKNAKFYKKQASVFLKFDGVNPAEIQYNSKWFKKMNLSDILEIASRMTVEQMIKRDMFDKRIKEGKPIFIHEFFYPLLQGYDSVVMDVDGEIGGNDQTFNMLVGRNLMKQISGKEKIVITLKLLEDSTGKKMGKTEGNMVTLADSSRDMFGKIMSWPDGMIELGFELCAYTSLDDLKKISEDIKNGVNPKDLKIKLAEEIVRVYHGKEKAKEAREYFDKIFSKKEIPCDIEEVAVSKWELLKNVLVQKQIIKSNSEFTRMIRGGGIKNIKNGEKILDIFYKIEKEITLKIGSRRFIRISFTVSKK